MNSVVFFPLICIPVRLFAVIVSFYLSNNYKFKLLASLAAVAAAIGFLRNDYINKSGFFGSPRYWSGTMHAIMYSLFAIMLFYCPDYAWIMLLVDVILGVITYTLR
jgi:hypothetical protein